MKQASTTRPGTRRKTRSSRVKNAPRRGSQRIERERTRDANATREDILEAATEEFADKGLSGARIDKIAERTRTSKRMIYYYFRSKDELYRSVLQREYTRIRRAEQAMQLDRLPADQALAELVRQTFDSHMERPTFVRLVMNENIHRAEHLKHVQGLKSLNKAMIFALTGLINRGVQSTVFRSGIDAVDLHTNITALSFYTVSNRYTFRQGFARDMWSKTEVRKRREQLVEVILRWCAASD